MLSEAELICESLMYFMQELTDEERLKIIDEVKDEYCQYCGSKSGRKCTCANDD